MAFDPDRALFMLGMLLDYLGVEGQQDRDTVTAAIPYAQALVNHYNANLPLVNSVIADANRCAPAAKIIADAVARKAQS